jgi:hypothetical protein
VLHHAEKQLSVVAQTFLDFLRTESQAMARSYLPQIPAFMPAGDGPDGPSRITPVATGIIPSQEPAGAS